MMRHIPMNAEVKCQDGHYGEATHVIVNPINQVVTFFVAEDKHHKQPDRVVPVTKISKTTSKDIYLDCTIADMATFDPYAERSFMPIDPDSNMVDERVLFEPFVAPITLEAVEVVHQNIPAGQKAIQRGLAVEATDGALGRIDEFIVHPESGQITHLVIREGRLWNKREITLPVTAVAQVSAEKVFLKLDKKSVEALPAIPTRRSYGWKNAETEFIAILFESTTTASKAHNFLKEMRKESSIGPIRNAAILVKDAAGKVSFKETDDMDKRQGTIFGALTGGVIGLVGGPVGAVLGAVAGAATGRVASGRIDMGFSDQYLKAMVNELQPNSSALLAIVEHEWYGNVAEALEQFKGQVFRQALTDEIVAQVMATTAVDEEE